MKKHGIRIVWRNEVAIDLGTAFVRLATARFGVVAIPAMLMPEPPLRNGVVVNPQAVVDIVRPFLTRVRRLGLFNPRVVVGAPSDAAAEERETLIAALRTADAASVQIVPEPLVAAVGVGMDLSSPYAQMIVDVGDGVTDCVIIRGGEILDSQASRVGCGRLRDSVRDGFQNCWGLSLGTTKAEQMIASVGVGKYKQNDTKINVRVGRCDVEPSIPLTIRSTLIQAMIEPSILEIIDTATNLLRKVPPTVGCEVIESGIVLTGGGALLPGLRERLAEATSIRVTTPAKPLDAVIGGLLGMLVHP